MNVNNNRLPISGSLPKVAPHTPDFKKKLDRMMKLDETLKSGNNFKDTFYRIVALLEDNCPLAKIPEDFNLYLESYKRFYGSEKERRMGVLDLVNYNEYFPKPIHEARVYLDYPYILGLDSPKCMSYVDANKKKFSEAYERVFIYFLVRLSYDACLDASCDINSLCQIEQLVSKADPEKYKIGWIFTSLNHLEYMKSANHLTYAVTLGGSWMAEDLLRYQNYKIEQVDMAFFTHAYKDNLSNVNTIPKRLKFIATYSCEHAFSYVKHVSPLGSLLKLDGGKIAEADMASYVKRGNSANRCYSFLFRLKQESKASIETFIGVAVLANLIFEYWEPNHTLNQYDPAEDVPGQRFVRNTHNV